MAILKTLAITLGTVMVLGGVIIPGAVYLATTPEEQAAFDATARARQDSERARQDLRLQATRCGQIVQRDLNDPSSFELVDWSRTAPNKVEIVFRARNGFNATITATETCTFNNK